MSAPLPPPPPRADRFLAWFCDPDLLPDIQGDLHELYHLRAEAEGEMRARLRFWVDVVRSFRLYALRRPYSSNRAIGPIMWKNYLVVALRTLNKHRFYSALNIAGLAIGLAVCLLIFLFVRDERSYDTFFSAADRIVRVNAVFQTQDTYSEEARLAYPAADLLARDFPEVEEATRLVQIGQNQLLVYETERHYEPSVFFADSNFFAVFDFPFVAGNPATALQQPGSVVLTESVARKYFGDTDPIGATIRYNDRADLTVTGLLRDLPSNTHFTLGVLISRTSVTSIFGANIYQPLAQWGWPSTYTYLRLPEGYDWELLQAKLPAFMDRNEAQDALSLQLQPLTDLHLHSQRELEMKANGSATQVYAFTALALLILLIACINFMNLSTARATLRTREVGMRKVVGARRGQLIGQFLSESVLTTAVALLLALGLVHVALPAFSDFVGKDLAVGYLQDPWLLLTLAGLMLVVGLGAGSYPAFYLSAAQALAVLRGQGGLGRSSGAVRKGLVVTQFAISIILVVVTGVVYLQMQYAFSMDAGYEREQVIVVTGLNRVPDMDAYQTLRSELEQHAGIARVTAAQLMPTDRVFSGTAFRALGVESEEPFFFRVNQVDYDYFETLDIDLVAGRSFSEDFGTDQAPLPSEENPTTEGAIILNEAAVEKVGWASPEAALGQVLTLGRQQGTVRYTVVGVARDIHFASLHSAIEPMAYYLTAGLSQLAVRARTNDLNSVLTHLDETWNAVVPGFPITRTFLDDDFSALYAQEARTAQALTLFAGFALLVACLGLLGLAAFTAERRRKEIGVRKVMGASAQDVVVLLSWDFTKLVLLANLIAWPLAYLAARRWLDAFAYHIDLGLGLFVGAGFVAFLLAALTVGWQAFRAAQVNPATVIRDA